MPRNSLGKLGSTTGLDQGCQGRVNRGNAGARPAYPRGDSLPLRNRKGVSGELDTQLKRCLDCFPAVPFLRQAVSTRPPKRVGMRVRAHVADVPYENKIPMSIGGCEMCPTHYRDYRNARMFVLGVGFLPAPFPRYPPTSCEFESLNK